MTHNVQDLCNIAPNHGDFVLRTDFARLPEALLCAANMAQNGENDTHEADGSHAL